MTRERFQQIVADAYDQLPDSFRTRASNVIILVEKVPDPDTVAPEGELVMGLYEGVPATEASLWDMTLPARITLFQDNIEAACSNDHEIREEIRLTLLHELGHHFGLEEDQLEDV